MSFRFVALSAQPLSDVIPASSPLNKSTQVISTASCSDPKDAQLSNPTDLLPVGLLLINEHRKVVSNSPATATSYTLACIRQVPLFLRAGILGIFVPFDQEIEHYSGVYLYTAQNMPNLVQVVNTIRAITKDTARDFAPTAVELRSFDPKYVQTAHLDLVRNIVVPTVASNGAVDPNQAKSSDQNQAQSTSPPGPSLFFLSNIQISYLATLHDHFVGYIELDSRKWPIFLDGGYLCLKLDTFESLLTDFPFWIDSLYRIRLGHFDPNPRCLPVVHFTIMRIVLPRAFEYEYTYAKELLIVGPDATKPKFNPVPEPSTDKQASWHDAAGLSFVPRASNTLNWQGQIPHNFPVIESRPSMFPVEPWLPKFVHQAIDDAQKCYRNLVQSPAQSSGHFECAKSISASQEPKIGQKPSSKAKPILVVASQNQAAGGRGNRTQSQQSEEPSQNRAQAKDTKKGTERGKDEAEEGGSKKG